MNGALLRAIVIGLVAAASPAAAQWTRVLDLPATDVHSVSTNGDTIVAGADTVVSVSTDGGATWKRSAKVAAGVTEIRGVRLRNRRIYAGTFGQGVFVSDNLGDTWLGFSQGLVGGPFNTQLRIVALLIRGDSLFAATDGSGIWVRNLTGAGTWSHFGELPGDNTSGIALDVSASDTRLLASTSVNGSVYFRDRDAPGWTQSFLNNTGFVAGLFAHSAAWTGHGWVVGTNGGLFRSALGQEPWTQTNFGLGILFNVSFAVRGRDLFAELGIMGGSVIEFSRDDGATWQELDHQNNVFIYKIAVSGTILYAGRLDGLWRRSIATVSVPPDGGFRGLHFALAGPQPVRDDVRFRFELPAPGRASIEVFDLAGRRAGDRVEESWSAGAHEASLSAHDLRPGVYQARLTAGGRQETVQIVHVR